MEIVLAEGMSSRVAYEGHEYIPNGRYKDTTYYRCVKYYSQECLARLIQTGTSFQVRGAHTCETSCGSLVDVSGFVESYVAESASNMTLAPERIFEGLLSEISSRFPGVVYSLPSKKQVQSRVHELRGTVTSDFAKIETQPLSTTICGTPFIRRNWFGDVHGDYHRILIWVSDSGLALLRQQGQVFIDGTFRVVPSQFKQCVIVLAFDASTNVYVPCTYSLFTGKSESLYRIFLHEISALLEHNWVPRIIVVDFEKALINAVKQEFSGSRVLGCFFHFKQALFKKDVQVPHS